MIDLKIDLSYLSKYYGLPITSPYLNKDLGQAASIKEQGGDPLTITTQDGQITVDANLLRKLLLQPEKLAKIMRLQDASNRYLIIQQLNEEDLLKLLPFLSSEQLAVGLQYFTEDGLAALMQELPKEQLINLFLMHFTMADATPMMKVNEMDEFFKSTHLEKRDVMEYFKGLDYKKFQQLMMNQFGFEYETKSADEYLEKINTMNDDEYKRFLQHLQTNEKMEMIAGLCDINPDYYLEFENDVFLRPMFNEMEKPDIIKTMTTLDPEFLVPMIEELPKEFVQVIATQIDPNMFAKMLSGEFPDMLMKMLAG